MGRAIVGRIAPLVVALGVAPALAVVVAPSAGEGFVPPAHRFVGFWNGASGVAVGERWVLSARHVGGGTGSVFALDGRLYSAVRVLPNLRADLLLVELDSALPGWHEIGATPVAGQRVLLAGTGFGAGTETLDGYVWSADRDASARWGANVVGRTGLAIATVFDGPDSGAIPGEAQFALYDSGGGLFTVGADREARLVGIAIAISGGGRVGIARYGASSYSLSLDLYLSWISLHVFPGRPIASSAPPPVWYRVPPPAEPAVTPAPSAGFCLLAFAGLLAGARRRG